MKTSIPCATIVEPVNSTDVAMSALRSTTPSDRHQPRVAGFNEQAHYDPFFPSSEDDEQLAQFAATELSPNPQAHQASLSPAPSRASIAAPASPLNTYRESRGASHSPFPTDGFHDPTDPAQTLHNPFNSNESYGFLSPNAHFSDNGYIGSSEHTGSPDYGDGFYPSLGNDFGLGLDAGYPTDLPDDTDFRDREISDPVSAGTRKSQDTIHTKTSIGTATLSSHLMSPILTDSASPGSPDGQESPTVDGRDVEQEAATNARLNSGDYTGMDFIDGHMQQTTPALTSSSKGTRSSKNSSPDRSIRPHIARAPSPNIRIQSYTRGDSPARGVPLVRAGSKRSRTSSHLAVEQDSDDMEDGLDSDSTGAHEGMVDISNRGGLDPQDRLQVSGSEVPNFKDQEENAEAALKNADVEDWLSRSEVSSDVNGEASLPPKPLELVTFGKRQRAKSTGDSLSKANLESLRTARAPPPDFNIPGPGVLINEDSGEEDEELSDNDNDIDDDRPESPPATMEAMANGTLPGAGYSLPQQQSPEPPPLYRAKLWANPLYDSTDPGVKVQPTTSNEAIYKYEQRSRDMETMSRAATWGTRRMSDSDLAGIFHRLSFSSRADLGDAADKDKASKRSTFLEQAAARLRPKRSGSVLKRKESETPRPVTRPTTLEHSKNDSSGSLGLPSPIQRMSSLGKRAKSPRINTGSAVAALTSSIATLGAGTNRPVSATATSPPTTPWTSAKNIIRRSRSRSDINGNTSPSHKLTELWTKQGGPPMPTLATPAKEETKSIQAEHSEEAEDEEEEAVDDKGVTIDLSIRADPIIPNLDGFKSHVQQLNPRLPAFMAERISQEQLRRYKKLVEFKVKHAQAIKIGKCSSGKHCPVLGGEPTYLPSKANGKEPEQSHTGFSIAGIAQSDDEANALAEGIVTPAQFPAGVPMPPVKRLPAEFECSLCFKVKKFHKPSDWSKHVHEDVQPFTCTFGNCAEPKSFKRKADWVRHENERHRQLEWWLCNYNDCNHKCYRKDNFVQHLVREHKLPEPKFKTAKASKPAVRGPSAQKARRQMEEQNEELPEEVDQVWRLVEICRHETQKNPKDEPCKFCGNICNSWKKLTVHLAKHMEQISMPVLAIVEKKDVTPETIISPIEQRTAQQPSQSPSLQTHFSQGPSAVSHYGMPGATMQNNYTPMQSPGAYYNLNMAQNPTMAGYQRGGATYPPQMPASATSSSFPARTSGMQYNTAAYPSYDAPSNGSFVSVNDPRAFTQSQSPDVIYNGMHTASTSQPHSAPYAPYAQAGPYQPPNTYQQQPGFHQQPQHQFSNTLEPSNYAFAGSPRVPSFSQGAPTSAPMPYNPAGEMSYSQTPNGTGALYHGTQGQGYGF